MEHWAELRTALRVAELGTLSAAAEALGIHRATVARHIDLLEAELGGKLFQRHARGYVPTEAGEDMLRVARAADDQFQQLVGRTRGRKSEVTGELVVTSVAVVAPMLLPALRAFRVQHPDTTVRFEASGRLYQLEYGEAHVAIRSGSRPQHPDNVVRPLLTLRSALYAHRTYVDRHGRPASVDEYRDHTFVSDSAPQSQVATWLRTLAPTANVVFTSHHDALNAAAVRAGLGIGFLPQALADHDPELIQVQAPLEAWDVPFWLVTHVDLHWTAKVQAIVHHLIESTRHLEPALR